MEARATAAEGSLDRSLRDLAELRISHEKLETRSSERSDREAGEARRRVEKEHQEEIRLLKDQQKQAAEREAEALAAAAEKASELARTQEALCAMELELIEEQKASSKGIALLAMAEEDLEEEKAKHAELKRRHVLVNRYLKI